MENKIKQILEILNGTSCIEAKFILGSAECEIQNQMAEKVKEVIFKI